jgi:hypothetical protein
MAAIGPRGRQSALPPAILHQHDRHLDDGSAIAGMESDAAIARFGADNSLERESGRAVLAVRQSRGKWNFQKIS